MTTIDMQSPTTQRLIQEVFESMPGGADGFLKSFGYLQFAEELLKRFSASPQDVIDAKRYRAMRNCVPSVSLGWPQDGTVFGMVFRHAPGAIPYQVAAHGAELDLAVDSVLLKGEQQ